MKNALPENQQRFVATIEQSLERKTRQDKRAVERVAGTYGIKDKTEVKELTELAIVNRARAIAHGPGTVRDKYLQIVDLYNHQVNISHRTSQSILLQQYSTPAPIGYIAGVFCGFDKARFSDTFFEPSAGNGLLTIAGNPGDFIVNEIDDLRNSNLHTQGFLEVTRQDATLPFHLIGQKFDAIITNPPFGVLDSPVLFDDYRIKDLDHLMALRALDCMKDSGKAAIIIGGHTAWDERGRIQLGKNRLFINYLYSHYAVADIININGAKLYSRQGTSFNVRLILIHGRKQQVAGTAPLFNADHDSEVNTFDELYERVSTAMNTHTTPSRRELLEQEAEALWVQMGLDKTGMDGIHPALKHIYTAGQCTDLNDVEITLNELEHFISAYRRQDKNVPTSLMRRKISLLKRKEELEQTLGAPYIPTSQSCVVLDTIVPDSMSYETHLAMEKIKNAVGGDIDEFVRNRLAYPSKIELCKALSAEQIDAVAMSIYNIEVRRQGCIIGDQTGIGKGRVAAAMIRYGVNEGLQPVFISEKANLFSDIYRDLANIGSAHLVPFIVNGRESKTDIKDENGNVIYQALPPTEQNRIFEDRQVPGRFDYVMATYSQFNSTEKKPQKPNFLRANADDNIFVLDESHNASGSSNTGEFLQGIVGQSWGVTFLSATFAKRPDNMPVYAMKTAISEAMMTSEELVSAITAGGVALQEILASQLVAEGQMIRRERSFEGVEVNYITMTDMEQEHRAIADNITEILRDIIAFQAKHVDREVSELDEIVAAENKEVNKREGTNKAGVDNTPYFSKIFNVINQMLFSIKADAVADRTIMRLKEGKKPIIAFSSTMGSFIEQLETPQGMPVGNGDVIIADFTEVLQRGLEGIMRYTVTLPNGEKQFETFDLTTFSPEAQAEYARISEKIKTVSSGITISPIDVIIQKLKKAGYTVAEVTGRKYEVQLNMDNNLNGGYKMFKNINKQSALYDYGNDRKKETPAQPNKIMGLVSNRTKINTNDAFRQFNNNEVDVLMINQSGSTGASAHAIVTDKVPAEQVRQRVMIVLQAELDINTEVQKRGRINRTGQILKPIYDYVNSAIPAESRLMMMLQKKLKSLDANTSSNQKQSSKILDVPDFLNKYGDKIVIDYLMENPDVNTLLDDPLHLKKSAQSESTDESEKDPKDNAAHKVSGRVAVLSTKMQQDFYNEISERYNEYVEYLKQIGEYDLEVEAMNLQTETIAEKAIKVGKGGASSFGDDSILETVRANVLKKPFSRVELQNILIESLDGKDTKVQQRELLQTYKSYTADKLQKELEDNTRYYDELVANIPGEKKIKKLEASQDEWFKAVKEREKELNEARNAAAERIQKLFANRASYLEGVFNFYYVGQSLKFPVESYDKGQEEIPAVFLGYIIDMKKKNPFAPSAMRLRIALSNSNKYLTLPASYTTEINSMKGASVDLVHQTPEETLNNWEKAIAENTVDRKIRYIITGNLLQAFSDYRGKLVSYTTMSGETKKGILMPDYWDAGEEAKNVTVPIGKALKIIKSMPAGNMLTINTDLYLVRQAEHYKIVTAASRIRGGEIFLDKQILALVEKHNFEKVADKMTALLPADKISELVTLLQNNHNISLQLSAAQFDIIKNELRTENRQRGRDFPKAEIRIDKVDTNRERRLRLLELEAEAVAIAMALDIKLAA